jgi:hypothetical protein
VPFSSNADVYDGARTWQWRALRASLGTTTGMIVMAMLGKLPKSGPAFGPTFDILLDERITCTVRREGHWGRPETIGTVISVRDNLRRLADHCKFSDADRGELFVAFQKCIKRDLRARSEA